MPTLFQVLGTATASSITSFLAARGTATDDYTAEAVQVSGTTSVDDTGIAPWLNRSDSPARWNCVRVFLGPYLIEVTGLLGEVEMTRDANAVVPTASFTLKDPRLAVRHAETFSLGSQAVVIKCYSANIGGGSWQTKFVGKTEAGPNEDPYVPRASFSAVGRTSWLGERNANFGCIKAPAFSEQSLFDYLASYLLEAGGTVPTTLPTGKLFLHQVDLSGLSPLEMARAVCEVCGYYLRDLRGELDFVWEPNVTSGPSKFAFNSSNVYGIQEVPPSKPVTAWTLSAKRIMTERLWDPTYSVKRESPEGWDEAGVHWQTITETYFQGGVQVRQVVTEWKDYAPLGFDTYERQWQIVRRTTKENTWVNGGPISYQGPTGQAAAVKVTVESMTSPRTAPSSGYQWTDQSWHVHSREQLMISSVSIVASTWDDYCQLTQRVSTTESYFAPQTSDGVAWADGKRRLATEETWQVTSIETETWSDNAGAVDPYRSVYSKSMQAWGVTSYATISDVTYPVETFGVTGQASVIATTTSYGRYTLEEQSSGTYGFKSQTTPMEGTTPGPETRSPEIPQFQEEALELDISSGLDKFELIRKTDSSLLWETKADLRRVGRRRLRDAAAPRVILKSRALAVLETLDVVDLNFPERLYSGTEGYIERIVERWPVLNCKATADVTVAFPPPELTPSFAELVEA